MFYDDERRSILIKHQENRLEALKQKAQDRIDKANALASLLDSYGWKIIAEEFIQPRMTIDRVISASSPEELIRIQYEMKLLRELLSFIHNYIAQAVKEQEILEKLEKG